jgi:hypothetical protein
MPGAQDPGGGGGGSAEGSQLSDFVKGQTMIQIFMLIILLLGVVVISELIERLFNWK